MVVNDSRLGPQMENSNSEDLMDLDSLEKGGTCIRCKVRDELVLVCSEIGCFIAVHERCMGCDVTFDDLGKFYCPYCKHRQARAATLEMRRKVMAAKKALLDFLEGNVVGGDKEKERDCDERDGRNEFDSIPSGPDGICCDNENVRNGVEVRDQFVEEKEMGNDEQVGCHDQEKVVLENEVQPNTSVANDGDSVGGGGEGAAAGIESLQGFVTKETRGGNEEDSEPMDDGEDVELADGNEEREVLSTSHVAEGRNVDDAVDGSSKGADVTKEDEGIEEDEEQMQPESSGGFAKANDMSENESLGKRHGRFKRRAGKTVRPRVVSPSKRSSPRLRKALRQKSTAKKNTLVYDEKTTTSKKSQESSKKIPIVDFPNAKRKRLRWTLDEEEMLKEGVQEFSMMSNVNLPWKKILEYGRHVFDPSRTPVDLKDKWRNLTAKEGASVNR